MAAPNSQTSTVFVGGGTPQVVADDATDLLSFYGTSGIARRASSTQAALTLTTVLSSGFGFQTSAGANAAIAALQEVIATLTALGLWKGAA